MKNISKKIGKLYRIIDISDDISDGIDDFLDIIVPIVIWIVFVLKGGIRLTHPITTIIFGVIVYFLTRVAKEIAKFTLGKIVKLLAFLVEWILTEIISVLVIMKMNESQQNTSTGSGQGANQRTYSSGSHWHNSSWSSQGTNQNGSSGSGQGSYGQQSTGSGQNFGGQGSNSDSNGSSNNSNNQGNTRNDKYTQCCDILQIKAPFTQDELKKQWKIMAKKYHPDNGGDTEMAAKINEAYGYLKKSA